MNIKYLKISEIVTISFISGIFTSFLVNPFWVIHSKLSVSKVFHFFD